MARALPLRAIHLLALSGILLLVQAAQPPKELFSHLVGKKVLATATSNTSTLDTRYPQYTDRGGTWRLFTADQWTSGFFPATLYQLNVRKSLCSGSSLDREVDWLGLGREWSSGILAYLTNNRFEHDVGFVSYPFQDELRV